MLSPSHINISKSKVETSPGNRGFRRCGWAICPDALWFCFCRSGTTFSPRFRCLPKDNDAAFDRSFGMWEQGPTLNWEKQKHLFTSVKTWALHDYSSRALKFMVHTVLSKEWPRLASGFRKYAGAPVCALPVIKIALGFRGSSLSRQIVAHSSGKLTVEVFQHFESHCHTNKEEKKRVNSRRRKGMV